MRARHGSRGRPGRLFDHERADGDNRVGPVRQALAHRLVGTWEVHHEHRARRRPRGAEEAQPRHRVAPADDVRPVLGEDPLDLSSDSVGVGEQQGDLLVGDGAGEAHRRQADHVRVGGAVRRVRRDDEGAVAQLAQSGSEGGDGAFDPRGFVGVVGEHDEGDVHRSARGVKGASDGRPGWRSARNWGGRRSAPGNAILINSSRGGP